MSNYERRKAMMEAERNSACEDFFIVDSYRMHMSRQEAFEAGFTRAWDKQAVIIDELLEALENLALVCNLDDQGEALKKAYEAITKAKGIYE